MTDDLIARLREAAHYADEYEGERELWTEAADALEEITASREAVWKHAKMLEKDLLAHKERIAELTAALLPFADVDVSDCADGHVCYFWGFGENAGKVSAAEVRAAHAAYLGEKE
jgi:hypothetical protein